MSKEQYDLREPSPRDYDPLPPPEQVMTIGIGFNCNDGIVIAADTQCTRGADKSHGPKIFPLFTPVERPDLAVVIAGAGRVGFMKRAVQKIEAALTGFSEPSLKNVQDIVEAELLDFYETHVNASADPSKSGFELILGVWTKKDGYTLLKTDDTTVTPVKPHGSGYCSIGMGQHVSEYALGLTYPRSGTSVESGTIIAAQCIKAAKDYVDNCGGKTHIWTLKEDGSGFHLHRIVPVEVTDAETYSDDLFDTMRMILESLDPSAQLDNESVALMTDYLKDIIIQFREKQQERRERLANAQEKALAKHAKQS
jgi:20S proteasome alpha/beta subunit